MFHYFHYPCRDINEWVIVGVDETNILSYYGHSEYHGEAHESE